MKTAILVDGAFYLHRHHAFFGSDASSNPEQVATDLWTHYIKHIQKESHDILYRIFVYDCPPIEKKLHHPLTNQAIDLSKSAAALFRKTFHNALIKKRKLALRLGYLDDKNGRWKIKEPKVERKVISGKLNPTTLTEDAFIFHAMQKEVDVKIGLDIASLAYKKQVDRIILIAGDSDFVPAAKFARREGIEFILDPMKKHIREDLQEHIDGLKTTLARSINPTSNKN
jgi:uncharacterized LabA/DUF88 family protein